MDQPTRRGMSRRSLTSAGLTAAALTAIAPGLMTLEQAHAQGVAPRKGGTLNMPITPEPALLVMGVNNQAPTLMVGSKIYQGLLRFDAKLQPLPELAKSWSLSDDKKTYTFVIQDNVKWHDGTPMTADDVLFSIMKFNFEVSPRARSIYKSITDGKVVGNTVVLTLDQPFEPFLLMFDVTTTPIMPKHIFDGTDYRNNPKNQTPIGTGPFKFTEWQRGNFIRLARFDQYWKPGQPYLDEIIYRVIPDSQSRALALQTGQVQLTAGTDLEPFDVPRFQALPNLEVETAGWQYFAPLMWMELNLRQKPLDDVRVRTAISHVLDRDFINKRIWFGIGKPATSPVSSATKFFDPDVKLPAHDPKMAAQLLDEAGLKPNAQGIRFTLKHVITPYGEVFTRLAEYMRTALKQVGIELTLESTDTGGWARRVAEWDYDTTVNFLYQYGDPTLGVERTYVSTNIAKVLFTNTGGYANPKVDELFATARKAADPAERQKAFFAVQELLVKEMPQIWLLEMSFPTIHDRKVHNAIELSTGVFASFDDVFLSA